MTTDHDDDLADALRRALDRDRHELAAVVARAFAPPAPTTTSTDSSALTHQDHAIAERLGATIHTPDHH